MSRLISKSGGVGSIALLGLDRLRCSTGSMLPEKLNGATKIEVDENEPQDRKVRSLLQREIDFIGDGIDEQK